MLAWLAGLLKAPEFLALLVDLVAPKTGEGQRAGDGKRQWTGIQGATLIVLATVACVYAIKYNDAQERDRARLEAEEKERRQVLEAYIRERPGLITEIRDGARAAIEAKELARQAKETAEKVQGEVARVADRVDFLVKLQGFKPQQIGKGGELTPTPEGLASRLFGPPSLVAGASAEEIVP